MIKNILIIDTETTGLDPKNGDKVIEVAAILYNLKYKSILQCFSTLLPCEINPVEQINNIKVESTQCNYPFVGTKSTKEQVEEMWNNPESGCTVIYEEKISLNEILIEMATAAQVFVAHNAEFDKKFMATLACGDYFYNKQWICTKNNFRWPIQLGRKRLQDICEQMNVPYVNAHRALNDCLLLAQCFSKIDDLEDRFNYL